MEFEYFEFGEESVFGGECEKICLEVGEDQWNSVGVCECYFIEYFSDVTVGILAEAGTLNLSRVA